MDYPVRAFAADKGKMRKYQKLIPQCLRDGDFSKTCYSTFVKTGEVFQHTMKPEGFFVHKDCPDRPRNINGPADHGYVIHAAVQAQLFETIKKFEPAFI